MRGVEVQPGPHVLRHQEVGRGWRLPLALVLCIAAALAWPAGAAAHGLVQRTDLPIPDWLFGWAAAIVLIVSFAALAALWTEPRLERDRWRAVRFGRALASPVVEVVCGAIGVALLVMVVWAGYAGEQGAQSNIVPTFVLVIFWVGLVVASVLFGDVFRAFNPWRAVGRVLFRAERRPYPETLGLWPAALGLLGFTWLELASGYSDQPSRIATATVVYSAVTWAGMALYGVDRWAEAFGTYFGLFARMSVWETRGGVLGVRPFLSGLTRLAPVAGTVAVVTVMIGTVTFDGLSQGTLWKQHVATSLNDLFSGIGFDLTTSARLASTCGLLLCVGLVAGFYRLAAPDARAFAHTLVPIAMAYAMAHYLSLLLFQGQAIVPLASDPLGDGSDLFGTASKGVDFTFISQNTIWYLQVAFIVFGHVCGLILAHDRALVLYGHAQRAVRSQYLMLGVMVGFTSLALWLLSQATV